MKLTRNLAALSAFAILSLFQSGASAAAALTSAAAPLTPAAQTQESSQMSITQNNAHPQDSQADEDWKNGLFLPQATITAAEGIQLIVNAFHLNIDGIHFFKLPVASDYYAKADNNAWYAPALVIAANQGFKLPADLAPDQMWTKEEFVYQLMTVMESRYNLPMLNIAPVALGDESELNISYQGAVQRALSLGIAHLDEQGNFHPKQALSRQETAELIQHAVEYIQAHQAPVAE
ncbi:S-layer homology domain-containing protein [Brevibacillus sp. GCM10020057]|uniref:S-layer homology domain-containing protein n=1 Tax=Brevibacillus sp. GCM10020057 TaxID=3317327 RepID=UPI0036252B20